MKFVSTLFIGLLALGVMDCSEKKNAESTGQSTAPLLTPPSASTATAATAQQHYVCPNNCAGSGGSAAGNCPVCGSAYIHNQAFHETPVTTSTTSPVVQQPAATPLSGVQHYTCPNNCAGSGGSDAGNCPVCGSAYVHNQAFHNQTATDGANGANGATSPVFLQQPGQATPATTPAQNAQGVYHYTCSNGCAGGSASAGNCTKCGAVLAHNQAYHN